MNIIANIIPIVNNVYAIFVDDYKFKWLYTYKVANNNGGGFIYELMKSKT